MSRNFDDMTEDEILGEALGAIPEYLERIRQTGRFDLEECVRLELGRIEKLCKGRRGRTPVPNVPRPFSFRRDEAAAKAERTALEALLAHFRGILTERTIPVRDRYLRSRKVSEINAITAKALITSAFADAGMNASVSGQRYRACVTATLAGGRRLRLYVRYRDLSDPGLMERVLRAVADLEGALGRLGPGACVKA